MIAQIYLFLAIIFFTIPVIPGHIINFNSRANNIIKKSHIPLNPAEIKINWKDNLSGDFSFKEQWDYPEGVFKNDFGQISCDGLCPPETDRMKDENGRILKDSLEAFYDLVDTTHQFYAVESKALAYEWSGTNFATVKRINADTVIFFTHNTIATHSSLKIILTKDKCLPIINLSTINSTGEKTITCKTGKIEIDKNLWNKGILKANFNFIFDHKIDKSPMMWKGKIYAEIEN